MNGTRLLLVDDNPGVIETLADVFRERDFVVDTADSGEQAVKRCTERGYDYVIMDVVMPGMSGLEALRVIREIRPETGVLMMTAYTSSSVVENARAGEALAVIGKPFDLDAVFEFFQRESKARNVLLVAGGDGPEAGPLLEAGFQVFTAPPGEEPELVSAGKADAVILHLGEDGGGLALLKAIRERDRRIPLLVISGKNQTGPGLDPRSVICLAPSVEARRLCCQLRLAIARGLARRLKLEQ